MRIIHFSDFHLQGGKILKLHKINANKLMDALVKINQKHKIDIIAFGGDLIDCGGKSFTSIQEGFKAFEDVVLKPLMQNIFVWLLDNFADDKTVLEGIHTNLHSFLGSGSIIPYHERNIFCFEQLLNHSTSIVRDWAKECLESEKKELNRELGNEEFDSMHYNL